MEGWRPNDYQDLVDNRFERDEMANAIISVIRVIFPVIIVIVVVIIIIINIIIIFININIIIIIIIIIIAHGINCL